MASEVETALREHQGRHVRLLVHPGPEELNGQIRGLLDSADGLVVFVLDDGGRLHTVHYHLIAAVSAAAAS